MCLLYMHRSYDLKSCDTTSHVQQKVNVQFFSDAFCGLDKGTFTKTLGPWIGRLKYRSTSDLQSLICFHLQWKTNILLRVRKTFSFSCYPCSAKFTSVLVKFAATEGNFVMYLIHYIYLMPKNRLFISKSRCLSPRLTAGFKIYPSLWNLQAFLFCNITLKSPVQVRILEPTWSLMQQLVSLI